MNHLFLTRKEADLLVKWFPQYMQTTYLKLKREWSLGGVRCTGGPDQVQDLQDHLTRAKLRG